MQDLHGFDQQKLTVDYPGDGKGKGRQLVYEMRLWSRYKLHDIDNGFSAQPPVKIFLLQ